MNADGKIIAIIAPSGAGKSTLIKKLKDEYENLEWSISYTTRPQREFEQEGVDYFFISKEEFFKMDQDEKFLERAVVHKNYYGTSKEFIHEKINQGRKILVDVDIQGADKIIGQYSQNAVSIFIMPPSMEELKRRLVERASESGEELERRLQQANIEVTKKDDYDHCIINSELDKTYSKIKEIIEEVLRG